MSPSPPHNNRRKLVRALSDEAAEKPQVVFRDLHRRLVKCGVCQRWQAHSQFFKELRNPQSGMSWKCFNCRARGH